MSKNCCGKVESTACSPNCLASIIMYNTYDTYVYIDVSIIPLSKPVYILYV